MDQRTSFEKKMWDMVGPPLYYCSECLRGVKVKPMEAGEEPIIERPNNCECRAQVIAPRKAIAVGEGGMTLGQKIETKYMQIAAAITGRCV